MKFFTKLFLAVVWFIPAVAGAEEVSAINYNPSRFGWFDNLKVVTFLSFNGRDVNVTNVDVTNLNTKHGTEFVGNNNQNSTVKADKINMKEGATSATIDFSTNTTLQGATVLVPGGTLRAQEAHVNNISFPAGATGHFAAYAKTTQSPSVKISDPNQKVQVGKYIEGTEKPTTTEIQGWQLGPNEIPPFNVADKCGAGKKAQFIWATHKSSGKKVLAIDCQ